MKTFYKKSDSLTQAKIDFFSDYIEKYLIKLLMGYGRCFIADLFCGPGRSAQGKGSPLVLLEKANYILTTPELKKRKPNAKIHVLFNDKNHKHIQNLKKELGNVSYSDKINCIKPRSKKFKFINKQLVQNLSGNKIPKFFFLDPFTYSTVSLSDLQKLLSLEYSEVLLFLPVFHCYRFAGMEDLRVGHKTKVFLENYTTRGVYDYMDISDFMESIKSKLSMVFPSFFVRPILLDAGKRKNALFLLTENWKGMLEMNKICLKNSMDGSGIEVSADRKTELFGKDAVLKTTARYASFKAKMRGELKRQREMDTIELRQFVIAEGFRPKDCKDILREWRDCDLIKIFNEKGKKTNRFYMGEKSSKKSVFKYRKN